MRLYPGHNIYMVILLYFGDKKRKSWVITVAQIVEHFCRVHKALDYLPTKLGVVVQPEIPALWR